MTFNEEEDEHTVDVILFFLCRTVRDENTVDTGQEPTHKL